MRYETVRLLTPTTTVRTSMYPAEETAPPGQATTLHYHDEIELLCVFEGEFAYKVYEKEYIARKGEVVFVNSRIPHSSYRKTNCRAGLLQFKESEFVSSEITKVIKYALRLQSQVSFPIVVMRNPEIFEAIEKILAETARRAPSYETFIKAYVYKILGNLYREKIMTDPEILYRSKEVQKMMPILSYINNNYTENLTLELVSEKMSFDHSYFCRLFKTATGATFTEYLNFVRVCKAEKLLIKTRSCIGDISSMVGFSAVTYFNRIFKKYLNCSPKTYRTVVCCSI